MGIALTVRMCHAMGARRLVINGRPIAMSTRYSRLEKYRHSQKINLKHQIYYQRHHHNRRQEHFLK
jgi:hypothetical protein